MSDAISVTQLLSHLQLNEYIAIDLETTGLESGKDRITEISACRFRNGKFSEEYTTLVNPGMRIPKTIVELTGISQAMVDDAPDFKEVSKNLLDFIGDSPLIGHNIQFDYSFLTEAYSRQNEAFPAYTLYDTVTLSRTFLYYLSSFNLGEISEFYDLSTKGAHRAGKDAMNTGIIFSNLILEAASRNLSIIQNLDNVMTGQNLPNEDLFKNIIKTSVKLNIVDGLVNLPNKFELPDFQFTHSNDDAGGDLPKNVGEWFKESGKFEKEWDGYHHRKSQVRLAEDTYEAFSNNNILLAEAGTGLGKSLAYLSAGFLAARNLKTSLVVSTHTKNLQNQLFFNDIPKFIKTVNISGKAVIYKGRHNYLCCNRLERIMKNHKHLLNNWEYESILPLLVWSSETNTGDISECNGFWMGKNKRLWSFLRSEPGYCTSNRCQKFNGCYLGPVRRSVESADIIIINHYLFANELIKENSCLPADFIYVIDEAHHLVHAVRDQLITQVGAQSFDDIFNFFQLKNEQWKLAAIKNIKVLYKDFEELSKESEILRNDLKDFFNSYRESKKYLFENSEYSEDKHLFYDSHEEFNDVFPSLTDLVGLFKRFAMKVEQFLVTLDEKKEDIPQSLPLELKVAGRNMQDKLNCLQNILNPEKGIVTWSSFVRLGANKYPFLNSGPLKVNDYLNEVLFKNNRGGLLCSATITVNDDFNYILEATGLKLASTHRNIFEDIYYSPFHYNDQVQLFVFQDDMDVNDDRFMQIIGNQIDQLTAEIKRRMMVLCTSYKQTQALKKLLQHKIDGSGRKLFVQGRGTGRNTLVRGYLENPRSILIGTSSFWEGIDFPGDKVEILLIVKTPFANPSDPLIQAQIEDFNQRGDNAFIHFQLPEAAMRLRQGFGRLIRNLNDTGICLVTDTRLLRKRYGKVILGSLPVDYIPYNQVSSLIYQAKKFF